MKNVEIMDFLLKNENLSDLIFENNFLRYKGKAINLKNFQIIDLFRNEYNKMYQEQKNISSEDFFNIIDLHTKKIENNSIENKEPFDIINIPHYFSLLGKEETLSSEEQLLIQEFHSFTTSLYFYYEYLLPSKKSIFDEYNNVINNLRLIEENNPNISLTKNQRYAIDIYDQMSEIINKEKLINEKRKIQTLAKKKQNYGFANNILILLLIILSGITLAGILYLNV